MDNKHSMIERIIDITVKVVFAYFVINHIQATSHSDDARWMCIQQVKI